MHKYVKDVVTLMPGFNLQDVLETDWELLQKIVNSNNEDVERKQQKGSKSDPMSLNEFIKHI